MITVHCNMGSIPIIVIKFVNFDMLNKLPSNYKVRKLLLNYKIHEFYL